jgi:hypothetical protein
MQLSHFRTPRRCLPPCRATSRPPCATTATRRSRVSITRRVGSLQHVGDEPKTLWNGCEVVVPLEGGGVAPETAPALGVTGTLPAEQGSPVIEFLPILGGNIAVGSAGETGTWGALVTVFPLRIGLVVFPLAIGLLVFCANAVVMVAVRTRTLRPIS